MQYGRSSMGGLTQRRAQAPVQTPAHSQRQRGVALVVVLLFLVAITGISVWTVRQSMLAEGMARNQMDQEVARQAAESALRDAEVVEEQCCGAMPCDRFSLVRKIFDDAQHIHVVGFVCVFREFGHGVAAGEYEGVVFVFMAFE